MGIKNLSKLIKKHAPNGRVEYTSLESYRGKTFAIDVPIFAYKFASVFRGDVLRGFREQVETLRDRFNITPIYVFDGDVSKAKEGEMQVRSEIKKRAHASLGQAKEELDTAKRLKTSTCAISLSALMAAEDKLEKALKRVEYVPKKEDYKHAKDFFQQEKVVFHTAPNDAEKFCVTLVARGEADLVVSEDYDVLPYFCAHDRDASTCRMLTGLGKATMVEYTLGPILAQFGITKAAFIDMCILSGCDFCKHKIKNVASTRALSMIQAHGTIESILRVLDTRKFEVHELFAEEYVLAREEFTQF